MYSVEIFKKNICLCISQQYNVIWSLSTPRNEKNISNITDYCFYIWICIMYIFPILLFTETWCSSPLYYYHSADTSDPRTVKSFETWNLLILFPFYKKLSNVGPVYGLLWPDIIFTKRKFILYLFNI